MEPMPVGRVTTKDDLGSTVVQLKQILVATDFSSGARVALDCALAMAKRFESRVHLVHVISPGVAQYVAAESSEEAVRNARSFAGVALKRLIQDSGCPELIRGEILSDGRVWPMLQEYALQHRIDLVALGTHGKNSTKKQLLGSVAEEIFRVAELPILTVGERNVAGGRTAWEAGNILYATNFKPHAEHAASMAYRMEQAHGTKLRVLHVVEEQDQNVKGGNDLVRDFMTQRLRKGMPSSCAGRCEPEFRVRFGDVVQEILKETTEESTDILVLGLRSGADAMGQLPSATAYKLVCQSPCPVLTTRT